MTDVVTVRDPAAVVRVEVTEIVAAAAQPGLPGPPGPPGPPGRDGIGALSADAGNALTTGSDGGLYCPAVITSTLHW